MLAACTIIVAILFVAHSVDDDSSHIGGGGRPKGAWAWKESPRQGYSLLNVLFQSTLAATSTSCETSRWIGHPRSPGDPCHVNGAQDIRLAIKRARESDGTCLMPPTHHRRRPAGLVHPPSFTLNIKIE